MSRLSVCLSACVVAGAAVVSLGAQDGAVFKDATAESIFRAARLAVGQGEGKVLALRSLVLTGRSRVALGDQPAIDASVEIRILLPDRYLRTDVAGDSRMTTGFSGQTLLTSIDDGRELSSPPPDLHAGLLKVEQARLARLLIGMAGYVSPYFFVTFRAMGGQADLAGPLDAPARTVIRDGRLDQNVIEGAGRDGFFVRMFVDSGHFPLTLAYRTTKDAMNEMTFADRRDADGLRLPFRITTKDGKRTIDDLVFDQVRVNVPLGAADFAPSRR
jgi:hypothetical protein